MQRDREYLLDIIEAAKAAHSYVKGKNRQDFLKDFQCQDAVIRRLEIIGEAARRVSTQARESLPDLPWTEMISMRNILIHQYDDIDMLIIWDTVHNDTFSLITALEKAIQS